MRPGKGYRYFLLTIFTISATALAAQTGQKPRLVVQIVVSQMRYDLLARFDANFGSGGFKRFQTEGVVLSEGRYNYMLTGTAASLATLTTGSMPSTHGVVGEWWIDFLTGRRVDLVEDLCTRGLDCDAAVGCYSPANLVVPTLGDRLLEDSPRSRVVTVAASPVSAVVMGGFTKDVYWCDQTRGTWASSTSYMRSLPQWVVRSNEARLANKYLNAEWTPSLRRDQYVNTRYSTLKILSDSRLKKISIASLFAKSTVSRDYQAIYATPASNTLVKEFAKQAVSSENLGQDGDTDLLNICFDATRIAGQIYGSESMEVEDMYCRLDADIADLLDFIFAQVPKDRVLVVLTSDHGASDSYDSSEQPRDRFNTQQFKVVMNGFLNAQYGSGDWVIDYKDRQLYLNRDLVYARGLSLQEVQGRAAAFALQFRGVSHAMTSMALSNSSFAAGHGRMMQNSFYQRRSGDVVVDLMPGWIEEQDGTRSLSGSMYDYDTHVPLMLMGWQYGPMRIRAPVDMTQLAPTLAHIMQINRPVAATGEEIAPLTELLLY